MKYLNIENWNRKEHFYFFSEFEEPFWGVTVPMDFTKAHQQSKELDTSFFIYYLFRSVQAANDIEAFRYRIDEENRVEMYDRVDASATMDRGDGTFGFSYIEYSSDYRIFESNAQAEMQRVKDTTSLFPPRDSHQIIHYSALPWLDFTGLSHARKFSRNDSCPKISFGKLKEVNNRKLMSVSIHAHHALMDGLEVGKYVDRFQELLNQ